MLTPRELFFRSRDLEFGAEGKINAGGKEVDFVVRIAMDFESGTRYLKFLINESEYTADICRHI